VLKTAGANSISDQASVSIFALATLTTPTTYCLADLATLPLLSPPARIAVIGDPIGHSKSPQMHNPALVECGIDAQYVRLQVPVGGVGPALRAMAESGFVGVNVTIPHKLEAMEAMDVVDPLAMTLGAVNTVHVADGRLVGYNSDGPGYLRSVEEAFGRKVSDLRVLILGAGGGAGRAVAVQSILVDCQQLILVNRTRSSAESVMERWQGRYPRMSVVDWSEALLRAAVAASDLIVNATSRGMKADDVPVLPEGCLESRHLVFDMVYRPGGLLTSLGEAAAAAGSRYVDGRTLLLHQGAISFEHWFPTPAPIETMRAGLAAALRS
jgi:shikimate dehydrogenase